MCLLFYFTVNQILGFLCSSRSAVANELQFYTWMDEVRLALNKTDSKETFSLMASDVFMLLVENLGKINHAFPIDDNEGKRVLAILICQLTRGKLISEDKRASNADEEYFFIKTIEVKYLIIVSIIIMIL